jgi:hypothetical protein
MEGGERGTEGEVGVEVVEAHEGAEIIVNRDLDIHAAGDPTESAMSVSSEAGYTYSRAV